MEFTRPLEPVEKVRLLAYGSKFKIEEPSGELPLSGDLQVENNNRIEQRLIAKHDDSNLELNYEYESGEVDLKYKDKEYNVEHITIKSLPSSYFDKATAKLGEWILTYDPLFEYLNITSATLLGFSYTVIAISVVSILGFVAVVESVSSNPITVVAMGLLGVLFVIVPAIIGGCVDVIRGESESIQVKSRNPLLLALISFSAASLLLRPDVIVDFLIGDGPFFPTDDPALPSEGHSFLQTVMSYYLITILLIGKTVLEGNTKAGIRKRTIYLGFIIIVSYCSLLLISCFATPTRSTLINWVVNLGLVLVIESLSEYYSYYSEGE